MVLSIADTQGWGVSPRGAGYLFGSDVVAQFNVSNDIDMICRAHQLVMEGYKWHFNETVLTVWSAPNYCYRYLLSTKDHRFLPKFSVSYYSQGFENYIVFFGTDKMSVTTHSVILYHENITIINI